MGGFQRYQMKRGTTWNRKRLRRGEVWTREGNREVNMANIYSVYFKKCQNETHLSVQLIYDNENKRQKWRGFQCFHPREMFEKIKIVEAGLTPYCRRLQYFLAMPCPGCRGKKTTLHSVLVVLAGPPIQHYDIQMTTFPLRVQKRYLWIYHIVWDVGADGYAKTISEG